MATTKNLTELVINRVESQAVYDYMVKNGLVNDDELYLVSGEGAAVLYTAQELTEEQKAQVRANIGIDEILGDITFEDGNSTTAGFVKLSDAVDSSSDVSAGIAATPKAVKSAYDLANSANTAAGNAATAASNAQTTANEANTAAGNAATAASNAYDLANSANTAAGNAATAASNAQTTANAAMPKAGGTFTGKVVGAANTEYTAYQFRNIAFGTSASTPTGNGSLLAVYS